MAADSLSNLAGVPPKDVTWEDPKAVTTRLGELGRLKRPDLVQRLLVGMAAEGMEINIFHCSSAASAYEKSSHWHRALLLLSQMSRMQLEANEYTQSVLQTASAQASLWQLALESTNAVYNVGDSRPSVVAACCSGGSWEFVFLTLSGLSLFSVSTSVTSVPLLLCSAAISSLGTRPDTWNSSSNLGPLGTTPWAMWAASLLLLQHLQNLRSSPDIVVVGAASSVCEKGEQWRWAQELLGWTSWLKLRPNLITSNSFISACQKSSLWPVALHHLHEAAAASIAPDTLSFNAAISACRRTWRRALQHLKLMKIWGIQWSNISYNSVMSSELQWLRSLGMMESMRATQVQTARVTYNAILDAMERGSMWQSGAGMFAALRTVQPDVVTYASSISSYVQVDAWAAVLELLTSMRSSHCTANTVTMTSAICACTERWLLATRLFRQLRAGNLKPNELSSSGLLATMEVWWQSLGSLTWMHQLGINGLPFNAAAASCALQFQWPRCLHLASENLDVVSSNALAVVCYRIHHPHLAATLMGPLQMAALETLSRQKKKQSMNQDSDLADSRPHENSGAAFLSFLNQGWNANEDLQHKLYHQ